MNLELTIKGFHDGSDAHARLEHIRLAVKFVYEKESDYVPYMLIASRKRDDANACESIEFVRDITERELLMLRDWCTAALSGKPKSDG